MLDTPSQVVLNPSVVGGPESRPPPEPDDVLEGGAQIRIAPGVDEQLQHQLLARRHVAGDDAARGSQCVKWETPASAITRTLPLENFRNEQEKTMQLHLRKFDPSTIDIDQTIVFLGRCHTGKSLLVRDVLYCNRDIPIGTVIHPKESAKPFYAEIVPPGQFIHDEYTPALLQNVVRRQMLITKKINEEVEAYGSCSVDPRAFLILDDCILDEESIRDVLSNGRHHKMLVMITMQYPAGIPPELRANVDYVFILRQNSYYPDLKRIYNNYT